MFLPFSPRACVVYNIDDVFVPQLLSGPVVYQKFQVAFWAVSNADSQQPCPCQFHLWNPSWGKLLVEGNFLLATFIIFKCLLYNSVQMFEPFRYQNHNFFGKIILSGFVMQGFWKQIGSIVLCPNHSGKYLGCSSNTVVPLFILWKYLYGAAKPNWFEIELPVIKHKL